MYYLDYFCEKCGEEWAMESDSMHDDRCPECDTSTCALKIKEINSKGDTK